MSGLYRLLHAKWNPPSSPSTSFAGKTVLVTGANTGLGFHAAKHFLRLQAACLVIGVRSIDKGKEARAQLMQAFPESKANIDVLLLDMNSYQSIRDFANRIAANYEKIDVAVLNAGIVNRTYRVSPEGWEETLQVNTLSTTLLAILLLSKLKASPNGLEPAHMVIVSSGRHSGVNYEDLPMNSSNILKECSDRSTSYNGANQYSQSKLFIMYTIKEIAARVTTPEGEPKVLVTSCCPGYCVSSLGRQYDKWYESLFMQLFQTIFARSVEEGSRTLVSAATLGVEAQGAYWKNDTLMRYVHEVPSIETARKL